MESKQISIITKVPGAYHESQYIMDSLDASLTVDIKSFKAEINILRNRYLQGNLDQWNASYIASEIIKTYINMFEDGTWKQELCKKYQIIALTTKLTEMQARFDKQIASFATQANNKKTTPAASTSNPTPNGNCHSKRDPYTVAAWCLIKKEDTVIINGREFH
jgi:hypothetical protein